MYLVFFKLLQENSFTLIIFSVTIVNTLLISQRKQKDVNNVHIAIPYIPKFRNKKKLGSKVLKISLDLILVWSFSSISITITTISFLERNETEGHDARSAIYSHTHFYQPGKS